MPFNQDNLNVRSDDEIQRVRIGESKPHNAPITLHPYDPNWPVLFNKEADRIHSILGTKILQMEHVGSTSVPELCAKPIIDMVMVVKNSADESDYVPALVDAGYILRVREPDWLEHRLLKGPDTDINLHVFSEGEAEVGKMVSFRNWLRTNKSDRDKYATAKRNLAKRKWRHVQHYADAKSAIIQEMMERASQSE